MLSQSPQTDADLSRVGDPTSAYRLHFRRLNELIRDGGSLSGHEPNCAFLNLQGQQFATVSGISGADFPDDGRAVGVVDWDGDGDLDLWIANRTAPMLRFLRNNSAPRGHYVALKLEGVDCNRDAVGARVELRQAGLEERPLIKTVKAGEGFLSQSSQWLHFGLGDQPGIASVHVRWPGGAREAIAGVSAGGRFHIRQGEGLARGETARNTPQLTPGALPVVQPPAASRMVLTAPVPTPRLAFLGRDGQSRQVVIRPDRPVLLHLWASWCDPCRAELQNWLASQALMAANVDIFALATDGQDGAGTIPQAAWQLIDAWQPPFEAGLVTDDLQEKLEQLHNWPFGRQIPLQLPTSLLLDGQGQLRVIYRGSAEPAQLLTDLEMHTKMPPAAIASVLPFPGIWDALPQPKRPLVLAVEFMQSGQVRDTADFVRRHRQLLWPHPELYLLLVWLGDEWMRLEQPQEAFQFYEWALQRDPQQVTALNNLAWHLATCSDVNFRDPERAVSLASAAVALGGEEPTLLDTLAAAQAAHHDFPSAVQTAERALQRALDTQQTLLVEKLRARLQQYRQQQPLQGGRDAD